MRQVFGDLRQPATIEQLRERNDRPKGLSWDLASRIFYTRLGNGVVKDGDKYWLSEEFLADAEIKAAEWVAKAKEEVRECQRYLRHYQKTSKALTKRGLATQAKATS